MMTYQEQIKHPKWQKKRLEVLKSHNFTCQTCGNKEEELHVHHPFYKRGAMIWEYDKTELECLCHRCHKDAHAIDEKIKKAIAICRDKEKVLAFVLTLNTQYPPPPKFSKAQRTRYDKAAKACRGAVVTPLEREQIAAVHKRMEDEEAELLAVCEDEERTPENFFRKMRAMMG